MMVKIIHGMRIEFIRLRLYRLFNIYYGCIPSIE